MSKDYIENHVRFLDEDGQTITVLCTQGDILAMLRDRLVARYENSKPKNLGYVIADVAVTFNGHLVRADLSDDSVEFVYVVAEVEGSPWITVFDNASKQFMYEGPA